MKVMPWILFGVAILGAYLNVQGRRAGFVFWIASNGYWINHNIAIHEYAQAAQYAAFLALSAWGWFAWGKG